MRFSDWILAHGDTLQFSLFFSLLLVLAIVEPVFPRRPGPMERRTRWPANLLLTAINFVTVSVLPLSLIAAGLWAEREGWGLLNAIHLPAAVAIIVTLLARAFISFFSHYLMHRVPLFWRVHRVHHLDTELDVTTTVRFHPLEFLVQSVPAVPIVVVFGLVPWVLVLYECLDAVTTLWTHSNLRLPSVIDRILRRVVVTPDLHRIHHSAWQPETDSNFGAVFPLWDMLFGTYRTTPRDGHETMRLGLDEVRGRDAHRPMWLLASIRSDRLDRERRTPNEVAP